jgi:DNA-directed RNA polymerase alpha subunit
MQITNFNVKQRSINEKKLEQFTKLGVSRDLLPRTEWGTATFILKNTYAGFANGIRRALVEELPTICMEFNPGEIQTDDQFILSDVVQKCINLIPINQELKNRDIAIKLHVVNETDGVIDVKASHISCDKGLIPIPNITITKLRPGKFLTINKIFIVEGLSKNSASKFSLLSNIKYEILDHKPYDVYEQKGVRSIEYDPKEFKIEFTTACNVKPETIIKLLCDNLIARLERMANLLKSYIESTDSEGEYFSLGLEVKIIKQVKHYRFIGEYITLAYMVGQRCFLLDANIKYCAPTINRYDSTEICIIKLWHPDSNKLLTESIQECIKDIKKIESMV